MRWKQKRMFLVRCVVLLICTVAVSKAGRAQLLEPLPVEDALSVRSLVRMPWMAFSPDGRWLAFTARSAWAKPAERGDSYVRTGVILGLAGTDIYISDVATGQTKNLTNGKGSNWLPSWSPDGTRVAFLSDRDGSGQARLWICDLANNNLRKVSNVNVRTEKIEWAPDGQRLLMTVVPEGLSVEEYVKRVSSGQFGTKTVSDKGAESTVVLYQSSRSRGTEAPTSPPWSLDRALRDLASVNVADGRATVIAYGRRIAMFALSPDGMRVAYTVPKRFERPGSQQTLYDLAVVGLAEERERIVVSDIRLETDGSEFNWSPDGKYLSYYTGGSDDQVNDCYIVDVEGGRPHNITHFPRGLKTSYKLSVPLWGDERHLYVVAGTALWRASLVEGNAIKVTQIPGRQILTLVSGKGHTLFTPDHEKSTVVVTHDDAGKQEGFYRVDLTDGAISKLLERGQCYLSCGIAPVATQDGQHVAYYAEDVQNSGEIWSSDAEFRHPQKLTHLNSQLEKYKMGEAKLIDWLSDDGQQLQGALLLPPDYRDGKRYPLIVYVYGGEFESNVLDQFGYARGPFNMQLLATRGYAVLFPDAPQTVGTPMFDLAKTILPGVNKLIEKGIVDPDRMGVIGHSNGGYSTLALIVQTQRFKAAIEVDGMGDLIGEYGEMDKAGAAFGTSLEDGQDALGGTLWNVRDTYIENSPLFYLDRVETPLLIVHGSSDTAVAPFLADQLFVGLRRLGRDVEYAKYEGEDHDPHGWSFSNQVDLANRMIAWFEKYLKARGR